MSYDSVRKRWLTDPESFWAEAAGDIDWIEPFARVLDAEAPSGRWFTGGVLNTCYNALDRHADSAAADRTALIYDSAMTGAVRRFTYAELRDRVAELAGAMQAAGLRRGDRALIYMPMIPESVMAMLACARLGVIHSVVFGGFAARELATRISQARPKLILTASCGLEPNRIVAYKPLLDDALSQTDHSPELVVLLQRPELRADLKPGRDVDWKDFLRDAKPADCVPIQATDPLYVLYTSGTTGQPKGIVRDNGGHAVALHWSMKALYGISPGDVFWAASDIGWVVGHSYIVYAPLMAGATSILYEGKPVGTPDAGAYWRVIGQHGVNALFTAPTAIRAIKREDPALEQAQRYDLGTLRALFLAGERCDPDTLEWSGKVLGVPVIDHWWQTETGWAVAGNLLGEGLFEVKAGSAGKALPGWDVRVLDENGAEVPAGETGSIVCRLPLPPGALPTLWQADDRFRETYLSDFDGCYTTGDAGYMDAEGYLYVMTRTDDVINVAGHRLSTGALEEVLAMHPDVAECAVTGIADALKGQVPLGFLCLKSGIERAESEIVSECVSLVREHIGPVAAFRKALVVDRLPKTRSGKVLRGVLAKIADGVEYAFPATIDDPAILGEIESSLLSAGIRAE
ncbi:MAG: propionyl-CoA synthetase [Gammaproteobacteria bacterium]|nr:propionyl-CoA synthetase [Gammaproteobacteria bacterium]MYH34545.1 propionyl-CoA synthetase [Gammaproteobacteria bacterium]MYL01622.1 propionyl-CoA synthetase [Gammaproteobacteria bacterium]